MYEVELLSLASEGDCGQVRTQVRACADALTAAGARARPVTATSDQEVDEVLARVAGGARLVVAAASDAQVRAVVRRMVRRWAPPPSRRPDDLPDGRTLPDLPPLAILSLDPAGGDLAARLGLPREPAAVAAAVLGERVRRLDLFRHDGQGGVTLDGSLLGSSDADGRAVLWRARVEVDDALLSAGEEPLLAGVVANGSGYVRPDGLPLLTDPDPADGTVAAAVAVPLRLRFRRRVRVEVRRARGRAVTVRPAAEVACLDDGVAGTLSRQRTWWVEPAAWAVYTG